MTKQKKYQEIQPCHYSERSNIHDLFSDHYPRESTFWPFRYIRSLKMTKKLCKYLHCYQFYLLFFLVPRFLVSSTENRIRQWTMNIIFLTFLLHSAPTHYKYITPELFLLLMMSLFTFYVVYFPLSFFAVYIIIFLPVVPFTYIIHTWGKVRGKVR